MRVLVIDDDVVFQTATQAVLERHGFEAVRADRLEAAAGLAANDPQGDYVAALLDWQIGDADGVELLPEIRARLG